ncbi:MAG: PKD domain-containing protein, partial [Flavobacteriales bacterium]|nr:PKD domain-containing protein [Flavobacteriales bacterium]
GFHFLSVRFQEADGRWDIAESRPVYIHGTTAIGPAAPLVAAEYFFDADPGTGNGAAAALIPGPGNTAAIAIDVDASTLPAGFHFLSVRFQDADGRWGIAESRPVYVHQAVVSDPAGPITAAEYFFDADPGTGNGTAMPITPGDTVPVHLLADASGLAAGDHVISIRFKHADGRWGIAESRAFTVVAHDDCADAIVLPVRAEEDCPAMATAGSTAGATPSTPVGCPAGDHPDVWYRVDAGEALMLEVGLGENGALGMGLQVHDGCTGAVLYCGTGLSHSFATVPHTEYLLQVFSTTTAGGFTICVHAVEHVTWYSQATGALHDPVWDVVPVGTAGPATFGPNASVVVQTGHTIALDGTVDVRDLTVEAGAGYELADDARTVVHGTALTLTGDVTAGPGSEIALAGPSAVVDAAGNALWHLVVGTPEGCSLTAPIGVHGTLTLEGGTALATNGHLTLLSDAAGTGRIAAMPPTATITGAVTMQRHIPAGATNWRLLGSAVAGQQVQDWHDDFITAGYPGSAYPGFDSPVGSGLLWPSIRHHDEPTMQGTALAQDESGVTATDPLTAGKGFAVWCGDALGGTSAFVVDLTGAPHIAHTPLALPVSWTDRGAPALDGWNLVGNPLPSAIAFDAIDRTDVADGYYIYDPASGNMAHWDGATATSTPTGVLNGHIASSQAFFLKATGAGANATVHESAKVDDAAGGVFGGDGMPTVPFVRLEVRSAINDFHDQTLVLFGLGGPGLDAGDALKIDFAHQHAPGIATLAATQELLMVNKYGAYATDIAIPVAVRARVAGTYVIAIHTAGTGPGCLWLEDLETGALTPVVDGAETSIELPAGTDMPVRFLLHATAPLAFNATNGVCGPLSGSATVDVGAGPVDVTWSTAGGTVLLHQPATTGEATYSGLADGNYIVHVGAPGTVCGTLVHDFTIINSGEAVEADIVAPYIVAVDEEVPFMAVAPAGAELHWDFGDGHTATGAAPVHGYAATGSYVVTLTATMGACSNTATTAIEVGFGTGTGHIEGAGTRVWGVRGAIVVDHHLQGGRLTVEVIDATGRQVHRSDHAAVPGRILVPAGHLAAGVWSVRIVHQGGQETFRVPLMR